jgi:rRNA maturation protein Rpf1
VFQFIRELKPMFPAAQFYKRRGYALPQIFEFCKNRNFTDVVVVHERKKRPGESMFTCCRRRFRSTYAAPDAAVPPYLPQCR